MITLLVNKIFSFPDTLRITADIDIKKDGLKKTDDGYTLYYPEATYEIDLDHLKAVSELHHGHTGRVRINFLLYS